MINKVSLLYVKGEARLHKIIEMPEFFKDLQITRILDIMCTESKNQDSRSVIASVLAELCMNPEDVNYRYDILRDFLEVPQLISDIQLLFGRLDSLERERHASMKARDKVSAEYKLAKNIGVFLEYCELYKKIAEILKCHITDYLSDGLKVLSASVCGYADSNDFKELGKILRNVKLCCKGYMRLKLEVHMDTSFKLTEAMVMDIDSNGFAGDSIKKEKYNTGHLGRGLKKLLSIRNKYNNEYIVENPDYILEQNVNEIKDKTLKSLSAILEAMTSSFSCFLKNLSEEILYYEGACKLVNIMRNIGLETVRTKIMPAEERSLHIEGLYDLSLALNLAGNGCIRPFEVIVKNNVDFSDDGRIQIITGPNQGGKTTYIRAIGILQVLSQAGIPVPAASASVSPVDNIYTHFPAVEKPEGNQGRLGEELQRIRFIIENSTHLSLVLMNESFASTNSKEGSLIAEDVLSALSIIGARCAFVTHMYELAENVEAINMKLHRLKEGYSQLISMAAQFEGPKTDSNGTGLINARKRTYLIVPGPPAKSSFAADIAEQFKIRYLNYVEKTL